MDTAISDAAAASGDMPDIITRVDVGAKTMIQMWVDGGIVAPITGEIAEAAPNGPSYTMLTKD